MTTEENLRAFMQDFHRKLGAYKFTELAEFIEFPFEITGKGGSVTVRDAADAAKAFKAKANLNRLRGVVRICRHVHLVHVTSLDEAIIGTEETAFDKAGETLMTWRKSYLIRRTNGIWRLSHANVVDYDTAWESVDGVSFHAACESSLC